MVHLIWKINQKSNDPESRLRLTLPINESQILKTKSNSSEIKVVSTKHTKSHCKIALFFSIFLLMPQRYELEGMLQNIELHLFLTYSNSFSKFYLFCVYFSTRN